MSAISGFINAIRNAVYGEQVRGAIADAITQCYDDVSNPSLNTAAFATAIANAYADGFLDIQEKSTIAGMTNQKIIYRYTGTQSGYITNALYYYNGTAWVPIGSGLQSVNNTSLMTNTNVLYIYTGTQTGMVTNGLYYYNGTAWELIVSKTALDTALEPISNSVASVAEDVSDILGDVTGEQPININDYTVINRVISSVDGTWTEESANSQSIIIPIPTGARLIKFVIGTNLPAFCFLTSGTVAEGEEADFVPVSLGRVELSSQNTTRYAYIFPEATYLYLELKRNNTNKKPNALSFISNTANDYISQLESQKDVILADYQLTTHFVIGDGAKKWGRDNSSGLPYLVPIHGAKSVTMTANINGSIVAFVNEPPVVDATIAFSDGFWSRVEIPASETVTFDLKAGTANYIFILGYGKTADYTPSDVSITMIGGSEAEGETATEIRDVPNRAQYLGYKRLQQQLNLPWTAVGSYATNETNSGGTAGNKVGVPYSSVKECDKYICWNVSIKTFETALHNPYSLFYTENVKAERSRSGYGFTYHGTNCGSYFGAVCNTFALEGPGFEIDYNTAEWAWMAQNGLLERVYDQSAYGVQLMDIIWQSGHGNVVMDIYRDSRGNPTKIFWAEQLTGGPVVHIYTPEQFNAELARRNAIIYRRTELFKGIDYTPANQFVATEGETLEGYTYNDDICTYAGDYACFFDGDPVHINYEKGSYTSMQLYKGDTLLQTITLPGSYNTTHSVEVTNYLTGYGKYKARLTDGTNNSDYTYFEVVDCNVAATVSNGNLTVTFSSHNGAPLYVQVTDRAGTSKGIRELTEQEIQAGSVTYDAVSLATAQSYTLSGTAYVKVFFVADYGTVRNDWLEVTF